VWCGVVVCVVSVWCSVVQRPLLQELAMQRIGFEGDMLEREGRHREHEAARRDAEERWRLRRKEREEVAIEEERIERAQKEEAAAIASARRAKDLQRVIGALDAAQRGREEDLARREAEREEQRRYRQRREAELEAARREEAELADNMISNLDRKYREQEQTAVALRAAEAAFVDRTKVSQESRTRAPFRADRAAEHQTLLSELEAEQEQEAERNAYALEITEADMERRTRAGYRIQRDLDAAVHIVDGDDRALRSRDYRYGKAQTGGPQPTYTDYENRAELARAELGPAQTRSYDGTNQAVFESVQLREQYAAAAYTVDDAASQVRAQPALAQIHNQEEYDYASAPVGALGAVPSEDRALNVRSIPQGRLFAGVLTPRQEIEEAREARHTLQREEKQSALEAARARREEAEYMYSARNVHLQQLQARHEQYLAEATPALAAAQGAASSLTPGAVLSLAAGEAPTPVVQAVCVAACVLLTGDTSLSFDRAREFLLPPEKFVDMIRDFKSESAGPEQIVSVHQAMRSLDVDEVLGASPVAATLLMWTANIARYNQLYTNVCPVRLELSEAAKLLEEADVKRREASKKVSYLLTWRNE